MKHNEEFKAFEPDAQTRRLIENRIRRLERKAQAFPSDASLLRIFVEANAARTLYHLTVTMDTPGKIIAAREEAHNPRLAIQAAFDEIERQVQKHKEALRHEHLWKRIFKRDELRRMKAAGDKGAEERRLIFFQLVTPHLHWLDHFTRHLIRYSEAMGEFGRGELNSEEIVGRALIRAYRQFLKHSAVGDVRSWLARLAAERLDAKINIEENVSEAPPQIFEFYQPDGDLKVADVIPDSDAVTPEEALADKELRECVAETLGSIPTDWRRILLMHYSESRPVEEVAESVGKPESEVRRILSYSMRYVRQSLIESGCAPATNRRAA